MKLITKYLDKKLGVIHFFFVTRYEFGIFLIDNYSCDLKLNEKTIRETKKTFRTEIKADLGSLHYGDDHLFALSELEPKDIADTPKGRALQLFDLINPNHKKHLAYLCSNYFEDTEPLLVHTGEKNGQIGFVFQSQVNGWIFVYELEKTHATYIWIFDENIGKKDALIAVEQQLAIVKDYNRNPYKKNLKEDNNNFRFIQIHHDSTESVDSWGNRIRAKIRQK
jgi:hypothetical protein